MLGGAPRRPRATALRASAQLRRIGRQVLSSWYEALDGSSTSESGPPWKYSLPPPRDDEPDPPLLRLTIRFRTRRTATRVEFLFGFCVCTYVV